jgi:hypothetical protein
MAVSAIGGGGMRFDMRTNQPHPGDVEGCRRAGGGCGLGIIYSSANELL